MKRWVLLLAAVSMLSVFRAAIALPFSAFDPRSFAMGGTGVASGTSANASFYNPGLLAAARDHDDFSLEFPVVAVRLSDPDELMNSADDFNNANYMDNFNNAVDAFNANPSAANKNALVASATSLEAGLLTLSNKAIEGEANAAMVIGIPSKRFGAAFYTNAWVVGGGEGFVSSQDIDTINQLINDVNNGSTSVTNPTTNFTSAMDARFALLIETGISLATQVNIGGQDIGVGITPKYVRVQTYDYQFTGENLDNAKVSLDTGKKTDSNFNLDMGLAKDFGNGWRTGLVVKNIVPKTYTTVLGNQVKVEPQARVGVAHQTSLTTIAADLDLTENKPVGFDTKTQYLGVGAEFDAWRFAQLRVGYRYNIAASNTSVATAGIGLSPFGVHLDLTVEGSSNEVGASLQLGFRF